MASRTLPTPAGPCRSRLGGPLAVTLLGGALLLTGCTGGADEQAAASAPVAATSGPPLGDPPSQEVDTVQTDAPVTSAALVLTFAEVSAEGDALEAAAFAQGVLESGGSCVLAAEQQGTTLRSDPVPAEPGPSATECGALSVPLPEDAGGAWRVSVTYTSAGTELTSESREVTVR